MTATRNAARILLSLGAVTMLGVGLAGALYLGYADHLFHRGSPESVRRAAELLPAKAEYKARWAAILAGQDEEAASLSALEAAVASNPRDSSLWIEMGLRAEAGRNLRKAESYLLEAARVDKQFTPRWTLANFYFRRNDEESFWRWAREAAAISYGDLTLLFRLSWSVSDDPVEILDRGIPGEPRILAQYLGFLLAENHLESVEAVSERLVAEGDQEHLPALLAACDRLIDERQVPAALRIWNSLCKARLLPYNALEPAWGRSMTNRDFRSPAVSHGFDWRLHSTAGVSVVRFDSMLRFTFSGQQPERCELLSQFVPVVPGRQYRFRFRYSTEGVPPDTGLRWRFFDGSTRVELAPQSPDLSNEAEGEQEFLLDVPDGTPLTRLVLTYERRRGTRRIRGAIVLNHASLEFSTP